MDRSPEKNRKQSSPASERWYLRVQGRTLGPLAAEEVKFGLETGEFLPGDKIASSRNPAWLLVSEHAVFRQFAPKDEGMRSQMLVAPPPPQLLRVKPQPAPAPLPVTIPTAPLAVAVPEPAPLPPAIPEKFLRASPIPHVAPTLLKDLPDAPADPETNESLEEATKELERFLKTLKKPEPALELISPPAGKRETPKPAAEISTPIPQRPNYEPIFFGTPEPRTEKKKERTPGGRTIQIQLKLPARPWRLLAWLSALALALFLAFGNGKHEMPEFGFEENKTRDLKDSRLSDPSSPTNQPLEAGDPVPPLKAPTRPQRE